jgi:hypothetical protein
MLPESVDELYEAITFSEPKPYGNKGMQQTYIYLHGKTLAVEHAPMKNISGMAQFADDSGKVDDAKYTITLTCGSDDPKVQKYHNFLKNLDEVISMKALQDKIGSIWIKGKKNISEDTVSERYSPIVKRKIDENGEQKYPDSIKYKINKSLESGSFMVQLFDNKKQMVKDDDYKDELSKGSMVKGIVLFGSIWFGPKGFGVKVTPKVLRTDSEKKIRGYAFVDSDDEDESDSAPAPTKAAPAPVESESEDESESKPEPEPESESESESEEERPPTPPPVVEKKKTRSKAK